MSDIRRPPRYHQERAGRTGDREKRGGGGGGGGVGATDKNLLGADGGSWAAVDAGRIHGHERRQLRDGTLTGR